MAVSTVQSNNKLVKFTQEINREWVRDSMFSPYMGEDINSIIRRRFELKNGGEQMNIPLVRRLTGAGVSTGTLVGNEEVIDNYGMRVRLDWARHAVVTNKAESQKDSADIFGEAKPLLSDWLKELNRDELIAAQHLECGQLRPCPLRCRHVELQRDARHRARQRRHDRGQAHRDQLGASQVRREGRQPEDPAVQDQGRLRVLRRLRWF
jgi:hypothetical protein